MEMEDLVISGLLIVTAAMDIKTKRIPNWWIGILYLIGLIYAFLKKRVLVSIAFSLGSFLISSIGFFIGAIGGADVKLIGFVAGWVGDWNICLCVFAALVIAACIGVVQMIYQRNFCKRMSVTYHFLIRMLKGRTKAWKDGLPEAKPISFAFCMLLGYWIMRYVS